MGKGGVTLVKDNNQQRFEAGQIFTITELGPYQTYPPESIVPPDVWQRVLAAQKTLNSANTYTPSAEVLALVNKRQSARANKNWAAADKLRDQIEAQGWNLLDTSSGPQLQPKE